MTAYVIAELNIHDASWTEEYGSVVHPLVEAHGGRYLTAPQPPVHLEGDSTPPSVIVLIEFPDQNAINAFYNSAEYQPQLKARLAGATGDLWVIEGS